MEQALGIIFVLLFVLFLPFTYNYYLKRRLWRRKVIRQVFDPEVSNRVVWESNTLITIRNILHFIMMTGILPVSTIMLFIFGGYIGTMIYIVIGICCLLMLLSMALDIAYAICSIKKGNAPKKK